MTEFAGLTQITPVELDTATETIGTREGLGKSIRRKRPAGFQKRDLNGGLPLRRLASTQPADPPPTMTMRKCMTRLIARETA
jgi:hypothetical protein